MWDVMERHEVEERSSRRFVRHNFAADGWR
jgi:hypothetical protein